MKKFLIRISSIVYSFIYNVLGIAEIKRSKILRLSIKQSCRCNRINVNGASLKHCDVYINGGNNTIAVNGGSLYKTEIIIFGESNTLEIEKDSGLNFSQIVIRGDNCKVLIGKGATFGSVYMVCMGKANSIKIGEGCMFAEQIDVWSTDSHPIYDNDGNLLNPSHPITIEDNVWVGKYSKILKGVTIHSGAVIGMGSIVTKDVKAHSLNVGNPAHCIRENISWERTFIKE